MEPSNCWAQDFNCQRYNGDSANCDKYCVGFNQLKVIYKLSNMPRKYQHEIRLKPAPCDEQHYYFLKERWKEQIVDRVKNGDGLFLFSEKKGNGKTTWSCKLMNEYFRRVALKNNMRCRGLYINVADFFQKMKENFDNPTQEFAELKENLRRADLVIWDDIGAEAPTRFVVEQLYIYINHRYSEEKAQIFTSNVSLDALRSDKSLGDRIVSRIIGQSDVIEFKGEDRRKEEKK